MVMVVVIVCGGGGSVCSVCVDVCTVCGCVYSGCVYVTVCVHTHALVFMYVCAHACVCVCVVFPREHLLVLKRISPPLEMGWGRGRYESDGDGGAQIMALIVAAMQ